MNLFMGIHSNGDHFGTSSFQTSHVSRVDRPLLGTIRACSYELLSELLRASLIRWLDSYLSGPDGSLGFRLVSQPVG